jgi:ribosomal protein S18 acetylase RimI-like enzyme
MDEGDRAAPNTARASREARSAMVAVPAVPGDAEAIVALTHAAFAPAHLAFALYRSAASATFLRERLSTNGPTNLWARVLHRDDELLGYTLADASPEGFHLGYIAVSPRATGLGVGTALLEELLVAARETGRAVTLDVFASNATALPWYRRHGFAEESRQWSLDVELAHLAGRAGLALAPTALREALAEESQRGVSRVEGVVGDRAVILGLLGGDVVRVLDSGGLDYADLAALVHHALPSRRELLLLAQPARPASLPLRHAEESIRLRHPGGARAE